MALYENTIRLKGFIGKDATSHATRNHSTFVALSLATKSSYKDKSGTWQSETVWHRIVVFGKAAITATVLKKGDYVEVRGEVRNNQFDSIIDGVTTKRQSSEVRASHIAKLEVPARHRDEPAEAEPVDAA